MIHGSARRVRRCARETFGQPTALPGGSLETRFNAGGAILSAHCDGLDFSNAN